MNSTVGVTTRPLHHGLTTGPERVEQEVAWGPTVKGVLLRYVLLTAIVTGLGLALVHLDALSGLRDADLDVSQWFVDRRTPALDTFAQFWSTFADTIAICAVALVACGLLWWRHRRRDAVLIAFGLALEAATFITANNLVQRERPPVPTVGTSPTTFSFPSGHVAATLVLYGSLALIALVVVRPLVLRVLITAVPIVLTACVAWARIYRGMHYTLDVLVGIGLGLAVLILMVGLLRRTSTEREVLP
jgi:undecaprenyl-diphosphatase